MASAAPHSSPASPLPWLEGEVSDAFARFGRIAIKMLGVHSAALHMVAGESWLYQFASTLTEPPRFMPVQSPHGFLGHVVSGGVAHGLQNVAEHVVFSGDTLLRGLAMVGCAAAPLRNGAAAPRGVLVVGTSAPHPWTRWELDLVQELADAILHELTLSAGRRQIEQDRLLLQTAVDGMVDGILVHDTQARTLFVNRAMAQLLGPGRGTRPPEEWASQYGILHSDETTPVRMEDLPMFRALKGESVHDAEFFVRNEANPDGLIFTTHAAPLFLVDGTILGSVSVVRDVTERRRTEQALARSEALSRAIMETLPKSAILVFDESLRFLMAVGEEVLEELSLPAKNVVGRSLREVIDIRSQRRLEAACRAALSGAESRYEVQVELGGASYEIVVCPVRLDEQPHAPRSGIGLIMAHDISAHTRRARVLREQADKARDSSLRDALTQLKNRRGFLEVGAHLLKQLQRKRLQGALLFIDLNEMKPINDTLGHEEGDRALRDTADLLRGSFRDADVLARLGGDEFVVLAPEADVQAATLLVERLHGNVQAFNDTRQRRYTLSLSVGVAMYDPECPRSVEDLLADADARMYEQKRLRRRDAAGRG